MMENMEITTLKVRKYKAGYELRAELCRVHDMAATIVSAYTPTGDYIGDSQMAYNLIVKHGIAPEKADPEHSICSIGFCVKDQKWYGWSHRALCGFGLGNMLYEENAPGCNDQTQFILHGTKKIENLKDAKQAAINFAKSVS